MLDPILRTILIAAAGVTFVLAFCWLVKDWKTARASGRALAAFYLAAFMALFGLQPIRAFDMVYSEPYILPPYEAARAKLLEDLAAKGWVIGAARPDSLVNKDHPLQAEVAERFRRYTEEQPRILEPDAPRFVFVGRPTDGWSRNPETTTISFVLIGVVLILSGLRHAVRWT